MSKSTSKAANGFEAAPTSTNSEGRPRTVGVEIEFGDLDGLAAAELVADTFGGTVVDGGVHVFHVEDTSLGTFSIKLDSRFGYREGKPETLMDEAGAALSSLAGDAASLVIPYEIASPPIALGRLHEIERLIRKLRTAAASGTGSSVLYAFALHLNPEVPRLDAASIVAVIKAYAMLSPWLWRTVDPNPTRRLLGFAEPFPERYVQKLAQGSYWPDVAELVDDYVNANPSRNRDLDVLPLLAFLDEARVRAALPAEKINKRPTFHYRLPDSRLDDPSWTIALEWNRWIAVERLAADRERLSRVCEAYLRHRGDTKPWEARVPGLAFA